jgi:hypothetical protein
MKRNSETGFVYQVDWCLTEVDGQHSAKISESIILSGELVTPFDKLTEDQVIGWVKNGIGEEQVSFYEAQVQAKLNELKTPTSLAGLPWQ